jgi:hypothetical protein
MSGNRGFRPFAIPASTFEVPRQSTLAFGFDSTHRIFV